MPENTLVMTYDEIRKRVGRERGYGTEIADWKDNGEALALIEDCLKDGSRMFYTLSGHEWSFLSPMASITLTSGDDEIELPWDFNFLIDNEIYFDDDWGREIQILNDGQILHQRQNFSTGSGRPIYAAVVADGKPGIQFGQRKKLIFWPTADQDYDCQIRYSILPNALAAATPMPYGGGAHAQTVLEACLAASERIDGLPQGPHNMLYAQALEASKATDRRVKARVLGQRRGRDKDYAVWPPAASTVTYTPGT